MANEDKENLPLTEGDGGDFDSGFDLGGEDRQADGVNKEAEAPKGPLVAESAAPEGGEQGGTVGGDAPAPPPLPEEAPAQEQKAPAPRLEAVPEELADELETLRQADPKAADLALEDSADGERLRKVLGEYGATLARESADRIFSTREAEHAEQARRQREVQEHNRHFMDTIRREHPDYYAMMSDPARKAEAAAMQQNILRWIEAKPYSEAVGMMQIAQRGRDPVQVCGLISRYKREMEARAKGGGGRDPSDALAVPGKGAPVAPPGIGDKDDFNAGFDL